MIHHGFCWSGNPTDPDAKFIYEISDDDTDDDGDDTDDNVGDGKNVNATISGLNNKSTVNYE